MKYPLGTLTKCVIENNFTESTASLTSNSLRVQIFFIATNYISSAQMRTSFYFTLNFKVFESAWHFFNLCLQNWLANSFGSLLFRRFSHPQINFRLKTFNLTTSFLLARTKIISRISSGNESNDKDFKGKSNYSPDN